MMRALDCARERKHATEPDGASASVPTPTEVDTERPHALTGSKPSV
jgi:hypothetical protein